MKKLIRYILNYEPENATNKERDEFTAKLISLSLYLLQNTDRFNPPSELKIESREMVGGSFGIDEMHLSEEIFKNRQAFLNDITIASHETCHFAQGYHIDNEKSVKPQNGLVCDSGHFSMLLYMIMNFEMPEVAQMADIFGIQVTSNMNEDLKNIYLFFRSFYELQSFELEADDFSLEVVKFIVKEAKKLELSETEKKNLAYLENNMAKTDSFYQKRKFMFELRKHQGFLKKMRNSAVNAVNKMFSMVPEFYDAVENGKVVEIEPESNMETAVAVTCQAFEIAYDKNYAKKLMNALLRAPQNKTRDIYIFMLAGWTEYEIDEEEEVKLRAILANTEIDLKAISYEEFIKEKKRVQKERLEIKNGIFAPDIGFNFN